MRSISKINKLFLICAVFIMFFMVSIACAGQLKPLIENLEQSTGGMTLWQMIRSGGWVMIVLAALSILVITLAIYDFIIMKPSILSPKGFAERIIKKFKQGKSKVVREICLSDNNIIAKVTLTGIENKPKGTIAVKESMESCARNEIAKLWQNIGYFGDIGMIAPLIGLLGTVLGMIQAFNVVAFQMTVVKPILLAGGISKAMITTAGGLIVAIPAMMLYSYFRGRVQEIAAYVETYCADIIKLVSED